MRVRALDANGDYTFGQGSANFLVNSSAAVAQNVGTRLRLLQGEWFLDSSIGTPYAQQVLGKRQRPTYDAAIKARILATFGVTAITEYSSSVSPQRLLTVAADLITVFGPASVVVSLGPGS